MLNNKGNILIVDDTPANLRLLSEMLNQQGYEVRPIPNGNLALRAIKAAPPDIILLDITMPDLNGYEVCQYLKENEETRNIPVIFISAMGEVKDKMLAFAVGGIDYITKPFRPEEVIARIENHLNLRNLQKQVEQANLELVETNEALQASNQTLLTTNQQLEAEIAERKKAEERLQIIQFAIDNAADAVFWLDNEARFLYANKAACQLLGYTEAQLQAISLFDVDPNYHAGVWASHWQTTQDQPVTVESVHYTQNGAEVPVEITFTYFEFGGQGYNFAFARDITVRRWATEQLEKSRERYRLMANRFRRELNLAHDVQRSLLPSPSPNWLPLDVMCYTQTAREVGGDFYNYRAFTPEETHINKSKFALAIGDVSGKGASAALLMATSLSLFRSSLSQQLLPGQLLVQLDQALTPYAKPGRQNCALCYIELLIDEKEVDKNYELRVANAGCIPPYIRHKHGGIEWPEIGGFALGQGFGAEIGYQAISLTLQKGDMIILTSDGVAEAKNDQNEIFGFARLETAIADGPQTSALAMVNHLKHVLNIFVGETEPHDDLTIVVVQV